MQHCWLRGGSNRAGLVTFGKLLHLIGLVRGGFHTSPAWPRGQLRTARLGAGAIYSKAGQERAGGPPFSSGLVKRLHSVLLG